MEKLKISSICLLLAAIFIISATLSPAVVAQTPEIPYLDRVGGVLLMNMECGTVLYENQADTHVAPASTTKMMTAIIAIELLANRMDEVVTVPFLIVQMSAGLSMDLQVNEEIHIRYLVAATIISGANDAAMMLAHLISGSQEAFVELMNQRATQMGMYETNYINPTGIDGTGAHTTPRDVAILAMRAKECRTFMSYAGRPTFNVAATNNSAQRRIYNRNYLIHGGFILPVYGQREVNGLNAGVTDDAGTVVVATASVNNNMYLSIVFGGSNRHGGQVSFSCHLASWALISWAANNFSYRTVIDRTSIFGEVNVSFARGSDYVTIVPRDTVVLFLPNETEIDDILTTRIEMLQEDFVAPIPADTVVGTIYIYREGQQVGHMELITRNSLSLNQWQYIITQVYSFVTSTIFLISAAVFAIVCVGYILSTARKRYRKQEQERIAKLKNK